MGSLHNCVLKIHGCIIDSNFSISVRRHVLHLKIHYQFPGGFTCDLFCSSFAHDGKARAVQAQRQRTVAMKRGGEARGWGASSNLVLKMKMK